MSDDAIQVFRDLLPAGKSRVENLEGGGSANNASGGLGGGGGGQHIGGGPFGGGGMDPWETSVENRLGSLDTRLGRIEARLGGVETSTATLTERVSHLPTKGWGVTSLLLLFAAVTGVVTFQDNIHKLISGSNASSSHQIQAVQQNN